MHFSLWFFRKFSSPSFVFFCSADKPTTQRIVTTQRETTQRETTHRMVDSNSLRPQKFFYGPKNFLTLKFGVEKMLGLSNFSAALAKIPRYYDFSFVNSSKICLTGGGSSPNGRHQGPKPSKGSWSRGSQRSLSSFFEICSTWGGTAVWKRQWGPFRSPRELW